MLKRSSQGRRRETAAALILDMAALAHTGTDVTRAAPTAVIDNAKP